MVKRKIKRGSIEHVRSERERLGDRFNPENESALEALPDFVTTPDGTSFSGLDNIPLTDPIRSPLPEAIPTRDITSEDVRDIDAELSRPDISNQDVENINKTFGLPSKPSKTTTKNQTVTIEPPIPEKSTIPAAGILDRVTSFRDKAISTINKWDNAIGGIPQQKVTDTKDQGKYASLYGYDSRDTDDLAIRGGYVTPKSTIVIRHKEALRDKIGLEEDYKRIDDKLKEYENENRSYQRDSNRFELLNRKKTTTQGLTDKEQEEYDNLFTTLNDPIRAQKINYMNAEFYKLQSEKDKKQKEINTQNEKLRKIEDDFGAHRAAAQVGARKEGVRQKYLKPFGEAAQELIEPPTVGDISKTVGYGGLKGEDISSGINTLFGGYRLSSTAGEWAKTKVGDRGLVESLVNVRPSGMITPFGAPGTIQNSTLGTQFSYGIPVRRIGVGEVTARPGYRLTPEDIKRKKANKSKPTMMRKKTKKQVASVKGSLSINVPVTKPQLKSSSVVAKSKSPSIVSIGGNIKGASPPNIKLNISPFTPKDFDMNINSMSEPLVKKKWLKVKI